MEEKKPRILVADDERVNRSILTDLLKSEYTVVLAKDGQGVLEKAHSENPPNLILLDVLMPGMNGFTVCKKLKESSSTCDIPVIFITAMQDEEDEKTGLDIGAIDYITKPFRPAIVQARVRNHITLEQVRRKLSEAHFALELKNKELEIMASRDTLTGLHNRLYLEDLIFLELKKTERYGYPFSIILLDIDHFKQINDCYGHQTGDIVLKQLAGLLKKNSREADILFRFGGEEFLILCPNSNRQNVFSFAEKLRQKIEREPFPTVKHITASFGHTTHTTNDTIETLIERADTALYKAKESGRNQVQPQEHIMKPASNSKYNSRDFSINSIQDR